ncbi:MAG TPA: MFS transporter [Actinoplanes sp.]|nr:MFS transporter [Actinoplanes sp.]
MDLEPTRRGATLAVLCAMALMIVLDGSIVAVAVPSIQRDLDFSPAGVAWVVNAYLVAFAGLLLLAGRLGDLIGAWRVFLAGIGVFAVASLVCGLAGTAELLVAGRFVQGAGGALGSAVILGMIVRLYPEPRPQARAMGVYSFVQASGSAIGFVAGGVVTRAVGWPWIFLINVPIAAVVLVAGGRLLHREPGQGLRGGVDVAGAVLVTAGLSLGVYAIVRTGEPTAGAAGTAGFGAAAVLLILAFLARQRWARKPLIPLRVLARPWLLGTNAVVVLVFAAGLGFQFMNALYVQRIMGLDALGTGLAFLPAPIMIGVMSLLVAPRLTGRFGPRPVLLGGLSLLAGGLVVLSRAPADPSYVSDVAPALVIMGLAFGVVIPALIMLSMAGAAPRDTGAVSGFNNTAQQAGAALGLAVLAAVAAAHTGARTAAGVAPQAALRDGYSRAFLVAAAFVVGALLLTALVLRHPPATHGPADGRAGAVGLDALGARSADGRAGVVGPDALGARSADGRAGVVGPDALGARSADGRAGAVGPDALGARSADGRAGAVGPDALGAGEPGRDVCGVAGRGGPAPGR